MRPDDEKVRCGLYHVEHTGIKIGENSLRALAYFCDMFANENAIYVYV